MGTVRCSRSCSIRRPSRSPRSCRTERHMRSTEFSKLASMFATSTVAYQAMTVSGAAGTEFKIRSIGVGSLRREVVEKDYADIAAMNLNSVTVTLDYRDFYTSGQADKYVAPGWRRLNQHLTLARKYRLYVILQMCG